jgi:hypothetical protein
MRDHQVGLEGDHLFGADLVVTDFGLAPRLWRVVANFRHARHARL